MENFKTAFETTFATENSHFYGYNFTEDQLDLFCEQHNIDYHHTAIGGGAVNINTGDQVELYDGKYGVGLKVHRHMVNGTNGKKFPQHWVEYYILEK